MESHRISEHSSSPSSSLIAVMNKHASISATFLGHEHVLGYVHVDSTRISGVTHPWEEFVSGGTGARLHSCESNRSDYCTSDEGFVTVDVGGNSFTVSVYFPGLATPVETWGPFTKSAATVPLSATALTSSATKPSARPATPSRATMPQEHGARGSSRNPGR